MSARDEPGAVPRPGLASTGELAAALAVYPDPVFILKALRDPQGEVVELQYAFVNEAAARFYGLPVGEILGRGQVELFPSVKELGIWDTYLGVLDSGWAVSFDWPGFLEDGVKASFRLTASPFGGGLLVSGIDTSEQREAQRALAETSRHYRLLAENASDLVAQMSPDGVITWVSPSVARTLGWSSADLIGTRLVDLVHRVDAAATAAEREAVYSGHEVTTPPGGFVLRMRARSGEYRWMSEVATPVADESGVRVGVVAGLRDVDDLVRAWEAARADRAALRATMDSLLDPHVVLDAVRDEVGQIVDFVYADANPAACAYNGIDYQDLIGARLLDVQPASAGSDLLESYRRVVETGEPLVLDDVVYPQELRGGAERHYDVRAARVGEGLSYTWRDVTDRQVSAQRLAESEEQYRLLAENASDVVMRLTPNRTYDWLSGSVADVLGWRTPDLIGHLIDEFIHPDDLARFRQVVADAGPGSPVSVESRFRRSDGTYRWVACRTSVKVDEDGIPVAVVGGLVDVADRKAVEAKEQERLQELEQFQRLTVGRELKMIELKKEIEYLRKLGQVDGNGRGEP